MLIFAKYNVLIFRIYKSVGGNLPPAICRRHSDARNPQVTAPLELRFRCRPHRPLCVSQVIPVSEDRRAYETLVRQDK